MQSHNDAQTLDSRLDAGSDDIDMSVPARLLSSKTVYTGAIFHVDDSRIALTDHQGHEHEIRRQVLRHAPCVVMLVHDTVSDRYLIEREYRVGSDIFAYGLPAVLMNPHEDPMDAALRELAEETGIVPDTATMSVEHVGDFYSSEGMTDELAHIMVLHLRGFRMVPRHLDADEHVACAWASWHELENTRITASNSVIAIQHEMLRRVSSEKRRNR